MMFISAAFLFVRNCEEKLLRVKFALVTKRTTTEETQRLRDIWEKSAERYDKQMNWFDRRVFAGGREWLAARAKGKVLEVAIGTGRNLRYYPKDIDLVGIDLSPATLEKARDRAGELGMDVELREADGQDLPFEDDAFDTVIAGLCMCNFPDPLMAVGEIKRVLKPGGSLVALDHVRSPVLPVRLVQHALNPLAVRFEGDHQTREPLEYYRHHGFEIVELERLKWGIVERAHVRKPTSS